MKCSSIALFSEQLAGRPTLLVRPVRAMCSKSLNSRLTQESRHQLLKTKIRGTSLPLVESFFNYLLAGAKPASSFAGVSIDFYQGH
jgi:hypothetical protein